MSEVTTEQKNEAIALFMGYKKREKLYPEDRQILEGEGLPNWYEDSLKYHSDWSWLMPVWYRFRDLKFDRYINTFRHSELRNYLGYIIPYEPIEKVHEKLYESIEWHNATKKQKEQPCQ